jgi:hypothetical protein
MARLVPGYYASRMEWKDGVQWKQTALGIWTRMPADESASSQGPARKIISLTANQPQSGKTRPPVRSRKLLPLSVAAR